MAVKRAVSATVYAVAGVIFATGAYVLYPLFGNEAYAGFEDPPPTVTIFQQGSLGKAAVSAQVRLASIDAGAELVLTQDDVSGRSAPGATLFVGLEHWTQDGFAYRYESLACEVSTKGPSRRIEPESETASVLEDVYSLGQKAGDIGGVPAVSGAVTTVRFPDPVATVEVTCPLDQYRFERESLSNRNVYLPGIETYGVGGATRPTRSYSVAREGSDFIAHVSQEPSETLAGSYVWYERSFDLLARQGLFFTVSNPELQQESSYRLFIAGTLLGLAGGLFVTAIQTAVDRRE